MDAALFLLEIYTKNKSPFQPSRLMSNTLWYACAVAVARACKVALQQGLSLKGLVALLQVSGCLCVYLVGSWVSLCQSTGTIATQP